MWADTKINYLLPHKFFITSVKREREREREREIVPMTDFSVLMFIGSLEN